MGVKRTVWTTGMLAGKEDCRLGIKCLCFHLQWTHTNQEQLETQFKNTFCVFWDTLMRLNGFPQNVKLWAIYCLF